MRLRGLRELLCPEFGQVSFEMLFDTALRTEH